MKVKVMFILIAVSILATASAREWKQEEGVWENKKTVTVWGYVTPAEVLGGD